jgi:hypothetical protein
MELVVALAIAGILLLGARLLLEQLADDAHRTTDAAIDADRDANAGRTLRALVGQMEVGTSDSTWFGGDERTARFSSWCDVPAGWQERCQVAFEVDTLDAAFALVARLQDGAPMVLLRDMDHAELRYLESAVGGGRWLKRWGWGATAPLAIGITRLRAGSADTTILRIGSRG